MTGRRDSRWRQEENQSERFAEGWAEHITKQNSDNAHIMSRLKTINVAQIANVWERSREVGVDIVSLMEKIVQEDLKHEDFYNARRAFLATHAPENYALPLSFDELSPLKRAA